MSTLLHRYPRLLAFIVTGLAMGADNAAYAEDAARGPDVVIIATEEKVVYEYRQNGHLRKIVVEPKFGRPYELRPRDPTKCFGDLECAEGLLPSWDIIKIK